MGSSLTISLDQSEMSLCLCSTPQESPHESVSKTESNNIEKSAPFMQKLKSPPPPQEAGNQWDTRVNDSVKAILYVVVY